VWDADGTRYLDAYNNVPHVGHGHPRVTRAIAAQTAALTTNTRYLTDGIVTYAERLASLLPGELQVCYFVNSGSEANDLAWRIARSVSGNDGAIVTEFAYHGWTDAIIELSPEEHAGRPLAPWVASVPPPIPDLDIRGAAAAAVARLADNGHRPAAAMIDSAFSSDGIFDLPPGYHTSLAAAVRAAGGLFIADEVQAGLGRVGDRFWGFAVDGFVPDVVTLGKPIGNGFPMGAVITTPAIAEHFAASDYFFSTFGGSPVAAAAGLAVLDVTRDEGLPARAEAIGARLRRDLAAALAAHGVPGIVRGAGLFIGIDVGEASLAQDLVEALKARRALVSTTGPRRDVLKIRPPMAFDATHAGLLLAAFEAALAAR
jgi:4-aminobutyrate aminotransferase-like enzyme